MDLVDEALTSICCCKWILRDCPECKRRSRDQWHQGNTGVIRLRRSSQQCSSIDSVYWYRNRDSWLKKLLYLEEGQAWIKAGRQKAELTGTKIQSIYQVVLESKSRKQATGHQSECGCWKISDWMRVDETAGKWGRGAEVRLKNGAGMCKEGQKMIDLEKAF